ncbi:DUF4442 domain-containing protein [Myxococcus fulvus]|uniref:DUF4442 domain-containing protein n=1 Tax=Myxococcus fulvus TaxID=33 RepID=UPI003B9D82E6
MSSVIFRSPSLFKAAMRVWPPYWGTGIAVEEVDPQWRSATVRMRQRFYNANAFGTHFGGSLYAMCDPHYALLLIPLLGRGYVIWDKAASIEFLKPARGTVTAVFDWSEAQLEEIREKTAGGEKFEPRRTLEIHDAAGEAVARVLKTLYVRRRESTRPAPHTPQALALSGSHKGASMTNTLKGERVDGLREDI